MRADHFSLGRLFPDCLAQPTEYRAKTQEPSRHSCRTEEAPGLAVKRHSHSKLDRLIGLPLGQPSTHYADYRLCLKE